MVVLVDNGHGNNTPAKRSVDGQLLEWKYTREIAEDVVAILLGSGLDARLLVTEDYDVSLKERVRRINKVCSQYGAGNVLVVSVHCNAAGNGSQWMNGRGWEAYSTKGQNNSDVLAECLYNRAEENFKGMKVRIDKTDGDKDKEANFYIIKYANCPAVLTENFFMDNKEDMEYMLSDVGRHQIARTHAEGIMDYIILKKGKLE